MNNNTKIILGMIAASVAGVAVGMLMAPRRGSEVRGNIRQGIDDLGERITDFVQSKTDRIKGVAHEIKQDVNILRNDAQTTVEHGKKIVS